MSEEFESAKEAAHVIQRDDIVVFLWSHADDIRGPFFNVLTGATGSVPEWEFHAHHIKHPMSRDSISLISAPTLWDENITEIRKGLEHLLIHIDKIGAKYSIHIWVHNIWHSCYLEGDGTPTDWNNDRLGRIFSGVVEMEQVTFLTTNWERIDLEAGQKEELKIKNALKADVEKGLASERLKQVASDIAHAVLRQVIENSTGHAREERRKNGPKQREKIEEDVQRMAEEDERVRFMQEEIDQLYAELNMTEDGRQARAKLKKAATDQKKYMVPLLAQLDSDNLKPEEKANLEKKIDEEYMLCLREFRGHFAEIRHMRITIGPHLRDFYGLLDPKLPKKRFGVF